MLNRVVSALNNRYAVAAVVLLFLAIPIGRRILGR